MPVGTRVSFDPLPWSRTPCAPTIQTSVALLAQTPARSARVPVATGVHLDPSKCSAVPASPTAHASFAAVAQTPWSQFPCGSGLLQRQLPVGGMTVPLLLEAVPLVELVVALAVVALAVVALLVVVLLPPELLAAWVAVDVDVEVVLVAAAPPEPVAVAASALPDVALEVAPPIAPAPDPLGEEPDVPQATSAATATVVVKIAWTMRRMGGSSVGVDSGSVSGSGGIAARRRARVKPDGAGFAPAPALADLEGDVEVVLDHREEAHALLALVVGVDRRLLDELRRLFGHSFSPRTVHGSGGDRSGTRRHHLHLSWGAAVRGALRAPVALSSSIGTAGWKDGGR